MLARKNGMANKPVTKTGRQNCFRAGRDQALPRRLVLYLASRCMQMPMSMVQNEK